MTRGPLPSFLEPIPTDTSTSIYTPEQARAESGQGISSTMTDIGQALTSYGENPYLPGGLGAGILGNIITGQQVDAMANAAEKLRETQQADLPGVKSVSDTQGNVYTISNPQTVAQSDYDTFGDIGPISTPVAPGGPAVDDIPTEDDLGVNFMGFAQGGPVGGIGSLPVNYMPIYDKFGNRIR